MKAEVFSGISLCCLFELFGCTPSKENGNSRMENKVSISEVSYIHSSTYKACRYFGRKKKHV